MELQYYLSILWRRKWLIMLSAIVAGSLAYYIISIQPPVYKSEAVLSTGVIDYTGINSGQDNPFIQELQIKMRFNNLMEFVTSRRCLNLLSFHLLNHDLQPEEFGDGAFRKEVDLSMFDQMELDRLNSLLATKLDELKPEFENADDELFFSKVAKEMGYDYETLKEDHLEIGRMGETDYVRFGFKSETPELSAFAASKFSKVFIDYFESLVKGEDEENLSYLRNTAEAKKKIFDEKQQDLNDYKEKGQLVDLDAQREATVGQIKDLEQERNEALKSKYANKKTIDDLEDMMDGLEPSKTKQVATDNKDAILTNKKILKLQKQQKDLTEQLIDGTGNRKQVESKLKKVNQGLEAEMKALSKYKRSELERPEVDDNTLANELYEKRVDATIKLTEAEAKLSVISTKLGELNQRAKSFVNNEAYVENLQREIEIAKSEYEEIVRELSKEELSTNRDESPLTIVEHAQLTEKPESDKKLLFTAFSGVVGSSMATFFIFLLTFLDNTMHSPNQFKVFTGLQLIGSITKIKQKRLNLQALFDGSQAKPQFEKFKELVRDFRFNLEKVNGGAKIFLVTSPREDEGKSFLITVLSHSLLLKQKRVLIIDTNFKRNTLSTWSKRPEHSSAILHQILVNSKLNGHFAVTTLESPFNNSPIETISNSGKNSSPLEGMSAVNFTKFLKDLSGLYDYIFLEGAALNVYSDTKELIDFSDKVIAVFSSESTLRQADKDSIAFLQGLPDNKFAGAVLNRINYKNLN